MQKQSTEKKNVTVRMSVDRIMDLKVLAAQKTIAGSPCSYQSLILSAIDAMFPVATK